MSLHIHRTHTQEETRNTDFSRLVPDFATVTATLQGELSLVLLEGKVATNNVFQIWDDKTKLGELVLLSNDKIRLPFQLPPLDTGHRYNNCVIHDRSRDEARVGLDIGALSQG